MDPNFNNQQQTQPKKNEKKNNKKYTVENQLEVVDKKLLQMNLIQE